MEESLKKVFNLINKTGDRCVVIPENCEEGYVVMSLKEYERLAFDKQDLSDLTEDEFLDKINRDIAVWKSQQEQDNNNPNIDNNFKDNLPEISKNYSYNDFEDDMSEENEEPFYFEKV